ncbi:MAG: MTAP family purine nucleoside phosphorylase [Coriobacteriia bacterium]|nr:MTAP family purine nucleoside phosphorylase [Coriobacteriia bacterium]
MPDPTIPRSDVGICGGSGTLSLGTAGGLPDERVEILADGLVFETPFGRSPAFTHFRVAGGSGPRDALAVRMHGWRRGVKRADASLQTFWVFAEAGVRKVLADGGVGSLNHLLDPRDVVLPTDFIDLTARQDIYVRGDHLLIMRRPICPDLHGALSRAAARRLLGEAGESRDGAGEPGRRIFPRGTYLVTGGPRFESPAEVDYMRRLGGDVIGQSLSPEVFLARDIGACYAGIYMVVNYAEGVVRDWEHSELEAIFHERAASVAGCVIDAVASADLGFGCGCPELRKPSLLGLPEE